MSACTCSAHSLCRDRAYISSSGQWVLLLESLRPDGVKVPAATCKALPEAVLFCILPPASAACSLFEFMPVHCGVNVGVVCLRCRQMLRVPWETALTSARHMRARTNQSSRMVYFKNKIPAIHQTSADVWLLSLPVIFIYLYLRLSSGFLFLLVDNYCLHYIPQTPDRTSGRLTLFIWCIYCWKLVWCNDDSVMKWKLWDFSRQTHSLCQPWGTICQINISFRAFLSSVRF